MPICWALPSRGKERARRARVRLAHTAVGVLIVGPMTGNAAGPTIKPFGFGITKTALSHYLLIAAVLLFLLMVRSTFVLRRRMRRNPQLYLRQTSGYSGQGGWPGSATVPVMGQSFGPSAGTGIGSGVDSGFSPSAPPGFDSGFGAGPGFVPATGPGLGSGNGPELGGAGSVSAGADAGTFFGPTTGGFEPTMDMPAPSSFPTPGTSPGPHGSAFPVGLAFGIVGAFAIAIGFYLVVSKIANVMLISYGAFQHVCTSCTSGLAWPHATVLYAGIVFMVVGMIARHIARYRY